MRRTACVFSLLVKWHQFASLLGCQLWWGVVWLYCPLIATGHRSSSRVSGSCSTQMAHFEETRRTQATSATYHLSHRCHHNHCKLFEISVGLFSEAIQEWQGCFSALPWWSPAYRLHLDHTPGDCLTRLVQQRLINASSRSLRCPEWSSPQSCWLGSPYFCVCGGVSVSRRYLPYLGGLGQYNYQCVIRSRRWSIP